MSRTHKDVEYHVDHANGQTLITRNYNEAAGIAIGLSSASGRAVNLDVVVWSRAGARTVFGDDGAAQYDEDPDASVFQRIVVRADNQGRIR